MKPILLIPSGICTKKEIDALEAGGYIPIITDEPDKIKMIIGSSDKNGAMLLPALEGLAKSGWGNGHETFVKGVLNELKSNKQS